MDKDIIMNCNKETHDALLRLFLLCIDYETDECHITIPVTEHKKTIVCKVIFDIEDVKEDCNDKRSEN